MFLQFYCRIDTKGKTVKRDLLGNLIINDYDNITLPSISFKMDINDSLNTKTLNDTSNNVNSLNGSMFMMKFTPLTSTVPFFWEGEGGFESVITVYAVDRQRVPPNVILHDYRGWGLDDANKSNNNDYHYNDNNNNEHHFDRKNAITNHLGNIRMIKKNLTRSTAESAGKLAHNDPNYFFLDEEERRTYTLIDSHASFRNLGNYKSKYRIGAVQSNNKRKVKEYARVSEISEIHVGMDLQILYKNFITSLF